MKTLRRRRIEAMERANLIREQEMRVAGAQLDIEKEKLRLLGQIATHLVNQPDPVEAQERAREFAESLVAPVLEALAAKDSAPVALVTPTGGSGGAFRPTGLAIGKAPVQPTGGAE